MPVMPLCLVSPTVILANKAKGTTGMNIFKIRTLPDFLSGILHAALVPRTNGRSSPTELRAFKRPSMGHFE